MSESKLEWQLYICRACGLIYNEEQGDPDSGLAPGTRFADIPDDWECPLCGVRKSDFELFEKPVVDTNATLINNRISNTPGIIIIGAGIAGWAAAEAIRKDDTITPIMMISSCSGDVYHKPELSVAIGRKIDETKLIREKGSEAAKRLGVNLLANTFVVGISSKLKSVRTTRGSFQFTHLIFAQGAKAATPDAIPAEMSWRINHLNAWQGLKESLNGKAQSIAIVGAGMVGCELAENLSTAGHQVSLIYRNATPLAKLIPLSAGKRLAEAMSSQGVTCIANTSIIKTNKLPADKSEHKYQLSLDNGDAIFADQIITATGLNIDTRIPKLAGLNCNNGIIVDSATLETNRKSVYALGDCISLNGEACRFVSPILEQAKVIAAQIRGEQDLIYKHESPVVRLKIQSCSLVVEGQPSENLAWRTTKKTIEDIFLEQWHAEKRIATLTLKRAS